MKNSRDTFLSEIFLNMKDYRNRSVNVAICNNLGVLMTEKDFDQLSKGAIRFNTEDFAPGVYTISIKLDELKQRSILFVIAKL